MANLGARWAGVVLASCSCAFALNPRLDINQYAHTAWTIRDGFFNSPIRTIAQTADGYLWLGTDLGLLRFDGVQAIPWHPPPGEQLPSTNITKLAVTRDGRLWIGTGNGLASWDGNRLVHYPELAGQMVFALLEDREGTVWAGEFSIPTGRLCGIRNGSVQCYGEDGRFAHGVLSLHEKQGSLWVGSGKGLWRWKPDPAKLYPVPSAAPELFDLIEGDNGALWIATPEGIRQLNNGKIEDPPLPAGLHFTPRRMLRDRDGGLWIGTSGQGLWHLHQGRTDVFTSTDGLSSDNVYRVFEDSEGNIWAATPEGLDRFRDFAIPTISTKQGLSSGSVGSVLAARDGSIWIGASGGLNRWNDGQLTIYRKRSVRLHAQSPQLPAVREITDNGLPDNSEAHGSDASLASLSEDDRGRIWVSTFGGTAYFDNGRFVPVRTAPSGFSNVWAIVEGDDASSWISDQEQGLIHLLVDRLLERIPWLQLGHKDHATALLSDPKRGGLWLGFYQGGVIFLKDGKILNSYATGDGAGARLVSHLYLHSDGAVWAATPNGLNRIKESHVAVLNSRNGLPCDTVHWIMEDDDQAVWLYMQCGLARISRAELDAWVADPNRLVRSTIFDSADGVRSQAFPGGASPHVAKSSDGRLWFSTLSGVSVIDPRHLPGNKVPPPVHIEQIVGDHKIRWQNLSGTPTSKLQLPALTRDLEIDYTALSLVAPEKIRFRYKLEGHDRDWQDVGNRRQALYNDLPPRNYRFRVIACNNNGVWNEAGAAFDFSMAPAYYQTTWFRAACATAFLAMGFGLYRLRLYQLAREFNAQMEGRVDERLRVARELHDTLLQSFQALTLRFQTARNLFAKCPDEALQVFDSALDQADQAILEGRDAIQNMRSSTEITNDLAEAISALREELASEDSVQFRLVVEGSPRAVRAILRDEVYRIAREAIRNAFRHAQTKLIEVEITYGENLRLRVRDGGKGIDPAIANDGRPGHYGIPGMRERAARIGGDLEIWTAPGAGTEIQLTIAGSIAFGTSRGRARSGLFQRKGKGRPTA